MIKGWNRAINDGFGGFYLELLAQKILNGVTISDFPSGVRFVFDKGREQIRYSVTDPSGFGDEVQGLRGVANVDEAVKRFTTAYERAIQAEGLAREGYTELAFLEWKKFLAITSPHMAKDSR